MNWLDGFLDIVGGLIDMVDALAWWRFWCCVAIASVIGAAVWFTVPVDNIRLPAVILIGLTGVVSGLVWHWKSRE